MNDEQRDYAVNPDNIERLRNALLQGDDDVFSRGKAARYLNDAERHDDADIFPIRDDEHGGWIIEAEADSLDGRVFIGKIVEVRKNDKECPRCGNDRTRRHRWDNGVVDGIREECTVCGYVHHDRQG